MVAATILAVYVGNSHDQWPSCKIKFSLFSAYAKQKTGLPEKAGEQIIKDVGTQLRFHLRKKAKASDQQNW